MNKDFAKIPENAESKAVDREKEEYPVQQVAVTYPIGEKEVKDAVKNSIPIRIALEAEDKGILKWRIENYICS